MKDLILLTGATGFVGRHILRELAERNLPTKVVIRNAKRHILENISVIKDIIFTDDLFSEDIEWWTKTCKNVSTIIHTAWYTEPGKYLNSPKNYDCLKGTLTMAKGAVKAGINRFVGIGTCFEYDLTQGYLSINTPLRPLSIYAKCKAKTYLLLLKYLPKNGVEFAWCRLFYLYGEGEDERRLIPYIKKQLQAGLPVKLTHGNQIRDYLEVREAAKNIVSVAISNTSGAVNICSGIPISIKEIAVKLANEFNRPDLLKFGEAPKPDFDPPLVVGIK